MTPENDGYIHSNAATAAPPVLDLNQPVPDYVIAAPQFSDWQLNCAGITYRPLKGKEPNAFHRAMQAFAFGFQWERAP